MIDGSKCPKSEHTSSKKIISEVEYYFKEFFDAFILIGGTVAEYGVIDGQTF